MNQKITQINADDKSIQNNLRKSAQSADEKRIGYER